MMVHFVINNWLTSSLTWHNHIYYYPWWCCFDINYYCYIWLSFSFLCLMCWFSSLVENIILLIVLDYGHYDAPIFYIYACDVIKMMALVLAFDVSLALWLFVMFDCLVISPHIDVVFIIIFITWRHYCMWRCRWSAMAM